MKPMAKWLGTPVLLMLASAAPSFGVECAAARAMADGQKELEVRKSKLQMSEWLLLDFLSGDQAPKSRALLTDEVARSAKRTQEMSALYDEVRNLPAGTPDVPDDGTPACEVMTRVKTSVDGLLDTREKEIESYLAGDYQFIKACETVAIQLVGMGSIANEPGANPKAAARTKQGAEIMMGPNIAAAKLEAKQFRTLADEAFLPSRVSTYTRYPFISLRCVRFSARQPMVTFEAASDALSKCDDSKWGPLFTCVGAASVVARP